MGSHVCLEIRSLCAGEVALCAVERFSSRMGQDVCIEVIYSCARVVALCAVEGLFSRMCFCVSLEVRSCSHCLQLKGFSPEWISMCVLRLSGLVQEKLHCLQLKGFFS